MCRACSTYGEEERCVQGFGGVPQVKRKLGNPRCRGEDNIQILQLA